MTQPNDDTSTGRTFTQADVDRIVADRLARERARYADYDDLKARAAEADKNKSQLDKIVEKLDAAEKRAANLELESTRREVADELGLTLKQVKRLQGKTRDELLADGREYIADNGLKPKTTKNDTDTKNDDAGTDADAESGNGYDGATQSRDDEPPTTNRRRRPTETLRSGAPATREAPDVTDPLELVKNVRRW